MSDLQCPARIWFIARDVFGPDTPLPVPCADVFIAGDATGALADVQDAAGLVRAVNDLADAYRGEAIVVVATRELIRDALDRASTVATPVGVAVDSSGWTPINEPIPS